MGSRTTTRLSADSAAAMDAIKKKMLAMKVEKDNACDRADVCEEASKVAKVRASKAEDEVAELVAKTRQLETELDLTTEKLAIVSLQLEEKEKSLLAETSGRADDNVDTIKKRLVPFHQHSEPVIKAYASKCSVIPAERGIDEIYADVTNALDKL